MLWSKRLRNFRTQTLRNRSCHRWFICQCYPSTLPIFIISNEGSRAFWFPFVHRAHSWKNIFVHICKGNLQIDFNPHKYFLTIAQLISLQSEKILHLRQLQNTLWARFSRKLYDNFECWEFTFYMKQSTKHANVNKGENSCDLCHKIGNTL